MNLSLFELSLSFLSLKLGLFGESLLLQFYFELLSLLEPLAFLLFLKLTFNTLSDLQLHLLSSLLFTSMHFLFHPLFVLLLTFKLFLKFTHLALHILPANGLFMFLLFLL